MRGRNNKVYEKCLEKMVLTIFVENKCVILFGNMYWEGVLRMIFGGKNKIMGIL